MAEDNNQEPTVITLENIRDSDTLKQLGALPGDKVQGNNIVRVYSEPEDTIDLGYEITEDDITASETLQNRGASPGDRVINNTLVSSGVGDTWTQFKYGFDKAGTFTGYTADILEKYIPLGEVSFDFTNGLQYKTGDELYGPGFDEADPEKRRDMILRKRERNLYQDYGPAFKEEDGIAGPVGGFVGTLADPSTLLPVGPSFKAAVGIGTGLGAAYSVAQDVATTGEVDPLKAAYSSALGAGGGVVGYGIGRGIQAIAQRKAAKDLAKRVEGDSIAPTEEQVLDYQITSDSATSRKFSKGLDKYLGSMITRLMNRDPRIANKVRNHEFQLGTKTAKANDEVFPFSKTVQSMPKSIKATVTRHLYNGDFKAAEAYMDKATKESFNVVKGRLKTSYNDLVESGYDFPPIENYFPRVLKDYDGFMDSIGKKEKSLVSKAISDYADSKKIPVSMVDPSKRSDIANLVVRGYRPKTTDGALNFVKPRKIKKINADQLKFYASPEESLNMYLRKVTNDVERRKFFGKAFEKDKTGDIDVDVSIGKLVQDEMASGRLAEKDVDEVVSILKSRFIGGEQSAGAASSLVRDLGFASTIANPISAITQLGDIGMSAVLHGFRNTIASMFGTKNVKLIDVGIDSISQEMVSPRKTAKLLNNLFRYTGFKMVDRLGAETTMNAALRKNFKRVKTQKGEAAFRKEWEKFYGDETDAIVVDLQSGKVTEAVKFHAFNELLEIQPRTVSEMPQGWADNPNFGRILYMLKSFTLKQFDVVRKNVVQEYTKGNRIGAAKNAALIAGYLAAANVGTQTIKDIILGRDVYPEDIPTNSLWALLGVFGMNKYMTDKYLARGDVVGAAQTLLTPAAPLVEAAFSLPYELNKEDPNYSKALRAVPGVGPMLYNWFGGGAEKYNERLAEEK
jgi:hypothetical protein|tara:strand:+ start:1467 stop:4190 length:2724 start_codon:yes stop_codon:yes gene_type:complete